MQFRNATYYISPRTKTTFNSFDYSSFFGWYLKEREVCVVMLSRRRCRIKAELSCSGALAECLNLLFCNNKCNSWLQKLCSSLSSPFHWKFRFIFPSLFFFVIFLFSCLNEIRALHFVNDD